MSCPYNREVVAGTSQRDIKALVEKYPKYAKEIMKTVEEYDFVDTGFYPAKFLPRIHMLHINQRDRHGRHARCGHG